MVEQTIGRVLSMNSEPMTEWGAVALDTRPGSWNGLCRVRPMQLTGLLSSNVRIELRDGRKGTIVVSNIRHNSDDSNATVIFVGSGPPPSVPDDTQG